MLKEANMNEIKCEALRWRECAKDSDIIRELDELLDGTHDQALADAFFQNLSFGTAGLRGIIGAGTNRMNIYTVGKATQGLANYLNATVKDATPCVVIARDSRLKGELFARRAACVLAANGIAVRMFPRIEPVPALSYAVRFLEATAGIVLTASHNPAPYNGYKVYGADGCQMTSDTSAEISAAIDHIDAFDDVQDGNLDDFVSQGLITFVPDAVLDNFLDATLAARMSDPISPENPSTLRVTYTPLCGSGLELVSKVFDRLDIDDVHIVPEQRNPDGTFPTCPYPNPEVRQALEMGIALARQTGSDLLLATDPDADRVGVACRGKNNDYDLISGNEMGVLLFDYLCRARKEAGILPEKPVVVSTIVSTALLDAIAADYGATVIRTLTGFKYIGTVMNRLEAVDELDRFILGFEESYGYLGTQLVRDKDAVSTCMFICQMAQFWKGRGKSLSEALESLYQRYGFYENRTISIAFEGAAGAQEMAQLIERLRSHPFKNIATWPVREYIDYQQGVADLPQADVLEFRIDEGCKVIIRPSGTEPKIKAYLFGKASSQSEALTLLDTLEGAIRQVLQ